MISWVWSHSDQKCKWHHWVFMTHRLGSDAERERERERVCVCVCVCVWGGCIRTCVLVLFVIVRGSLTCTTILIRTVHAHSEHCETGTEVSAQMLTHKDLKTIIHLVSSRNWTLQSSAFIYANHQWPLDPRSKNCWHCTQCQQNSVAGWGGYPWLVPREAAAAPPLQASPSNSHTETIVNSLAVSTGVRLQFP